MADSVGVLDRGVNVAEIDNVASADFVAVSECEGDGAEIVSLASLDGVRCVCVIDRESLRTAKLSKTLIAQNIF